MALKIRLYLISGTHMVLKMTNPIEHKHNYLNNIESHIQAGEIDKILTAILCVENDEYNRTYTKTEKLVKLKEIVIAYGKTI